MLTVIFVDSFGVERPVQGNVGETVMELARRCGIAEIRSDCGGSAACASCHVYVEYSATDMLPPPEQRELSMLDTVIARGANSRLSCQIKLVPELDGLRLRTPAEQK